MSRTTRPLALAAIGAVIGAMGQEVRGVPKAEWPTYHTGGAVFNCRDGTHSIPFARLNGARLCCLPLSACACCLPASCFLLAAAHLTLHRAHADDYCDCADGSDEPGTSACLSGRFFCANRGFRSQYVRSSHVGDGVCDCCDGRDEYASGACPDVCQQAGAAARVEAAEILHKVTAGLDKATRWAAEGSSAKTGWETELAGLKASLLEKQSAADALAEVKKVAEARESELRDAFLKKREEEAASQKAAAAANGSDEPAPSEAAAAASETPEGGEQAGGAASEPDAGGAAGDSDADLDAEYPPTDVHPSEEGEHEYAGEEGGDGEYGDEDDNRHWDDIDHEPTEAPADEPADEPAADEPAVDADVPTDPGARATLPRACTHTRPCERRDASPSISGRATQPFAIAHYAGDSQAVAGRVSRGRAEGSVERPEGPWKPMEAHGQPMDSPWTARGAPWNARGERGRPPLLPWGQRCAGALLPLAAVCRHCGGARGMPSDTRFPAGETASREQCVFNRACRRRKGARVDSVCPRSPRPAGEGSDEGSTEDDGWLTAAASRMDHARLSFIRGLRYALGFSWLRKWLGVKSSSSSSKASDRPYADFSDPGGGCPGGWTASSRDGTLPRRDPSRDGASQSLPSPRPLPSLIPRLAPTSHTHPLPPSPSVRRG